MIRKDRRNVLRTPGLAETVLQPEAYPYSKEDMDLAKQGKPYRTARAHWPTPRAREPGSTSSGHGISLNEAGKLWSTFGFLNPILVDTSSGIIAGHGRLQAAKQLGLTQVPVVVLDHLTENQKRAYVIADNKLALNAGWDDELLRSEMAALAAEDFDLPLIGFSDEELADLLEGGQLPAGNTDEDAVPEVPVEPVTKPGDVYILGNHRLLCGDSTVLANVEQVLDGSLADMIFSDPPYNVDYGNSAKDKMRGKKRKIINDDLGAEFERFLYDVCVNMLTVCKGAIYVCMSSSELHTLQKAFTEAGGHWSTFVIWAKNHFTMGRADYQRQYEPILYGWKQGVDHFWCGARDQGDVWLVNKPIHWRPIKFGVDTRSY